MVNRLPVRSRNPVNYPIPEYQEASRGRLDQALRGAFLRLWPTFATCLNMLAVSAALQHNQTTMGIAAYNRGTEAIRKQFDQEIQARHDKPPVNVHYFLKEDLQPLYKRIADLESELGRARFCVQRLRATLDVERDESRRQVTHFKEWKKRLFERSERYLNNWIFTSTCIRENISPEQYHEWREMHEAYNAAGR